jgi:hypothetical protein
MNTSKHIIILITLGILFLILSTLSAEEQIKPLETDQCVSCHIDDENLPPDFKDYDIHLQPGLSCAGCHGGDPTEEDMDEAMSIKAGFIGIPDKNQIPQFCGKCHSDIEFMRQYQPRIATDQVEQYYTSYHGKMLEDGDKKVADCSSCHTSHAITSAKDTRSTVYALNVPATCAQCHGDSDYMKSYNIPTDQYEKYAKSAHGVSLLEKQDTGAPACNDCHGNHGATPPGIVSIGHVCGLCHVNNMQYFSSSAMGKVFEEQELHACEECHGHHLVKKTTDEMIGVGDESVCLECHSEGDEGYMVAESLYVELKGAIALYDSAYVRLSEVKQKGMDDVDIGYLLRDAHQNIIKSRTLVHTFDPAKVSVKTGESAANSKSAIMLANKEVEDYYIRRRGFGLATIFITILVVALFFKIRDMESKRSESKSNQPKPKI